MSFFFVSRRAVTSKVTVAKPGGGVTRGRDHRPPGSRLAPAQTFLLLGVSRCCGARAPTGGCQGPRAQTQRSSRLGRPRSCAVSNPPGELAGGLPPASSPCPQLYAAASSIRDRTARYCPSGIPVGLPLPSCPTSRRSLRVCRQAQAPWARPELPIR
jgi:hypothetical protein